MSTLCSSLSSSFSATQSSLVLKTQLGRNRPPPWASAGTRASISRLWLAFAIFLTVFSNGYTTQYPTSQPLPPLNIALVKHQLDKFRMPPPSKPAAPKPAAPKPTIPKPAAAPKPGAAPKPVAAPKSAASPKPAAPKPAAPPKPATGRSNATSREQEAAFLRALETRLDNFSVHIDNKFNSLQVLQ